jgi:hypothetical protein
MVTNRSYNKRTWFIEIVLMISIYSNIRHSKIFKKMQNITLSVLFRNSIKKIINTYA